MLKKINPKTPGEIKKMRDGGARLASIKNALKDQIKVGVSAGEIEKLATSLIKKTGGKPSFKMVPGYSWSTCVNVNEGVVHGIPHEAIVFKSGDIVSVDVGLYYKGFHTDTSFSVYLGKDQKMEKFLTAGKEALQVGIKKALANNRIYDISKAIEDSLKRNDLSPVRALVGHGIGKKLHEEPMIPCFTKQERKETYKIPNGATFAIEVMYVGGSDKLALEEDGWTISTKDGSISGLFEETVVVAKNGPEILTLGNSPRL